MKQQSFPTKTPDNNIIVHAATKLASFKKWKTIDSSGSRDESIGDTNPADTSFDTVIARTYTTQSTMVTESMKSIKIRRMMVCRLLTYTLQI